MRVKHDEIVKPSHCSLCSIIVSSIAVFGLYRLSYPLTPPPSFFISPFPSPYSSSSPSGLPFTKVHLSTPFNSEYIVLAMQYLSLAERDCRTNEIRHFIDHLPPTHL